MIGIDMINEIIISNILMLISSFPLQFQPQASAHPYITNLVNAAIVVALIAIAIQFVYAFLRKKFTDMDKMAQIMKETKEFRKQYMDAIKKQDKEMLEKLKKKKPYIDKLSMDMFSMNMKPMMIFMIPMFIIWIYALPNLIGYTAAVSPISLNLLGELIPLTCTTNMIVNDVNDISEDLNAKADEINNPQAASQIRNLVEEAKRSVEEGKYVDARDKLLNAYNILNSTLEEPVQERVPRCTMENEVLLWAWYFIVSIAFSGIVMRVTKTNIQAF
ncbi:MAG: hypothetical protein KatS3mg003_0181 [Candidatus Nitrosocaldaceae archaeon]|nr:MAG: hypothetical protein KatS3mg003_0181 [Candidatus Nitrosocaldaceae archaeon]